MAVNHRIVVNPTSLPFSTYPIQISTTVPFVVNYHATSYGGAMRATGKRIWDTSVLPSTNTVTVQANTPLTFPFTTNQLPINYFDAVFLLNINNDRYIQGFSNSPDNVAAYSSNYFLEDKKMFSCNLRCMGFGNQIGNFDVNNHYMFGGDPSYLDHTTPIILTFAAPTLTDITMSAEATLHDYVGTVYPTKTISFTVPAGSLTYQSVDLLLGNFYYTQNGITNIFSITGYMTVQIIPTDTSYVSILPFYHWGIAS